MQAATLIIDQKAYIRDFLECKGMSSCYLIVLLMKAGSSLVLNQTGGFIKADMNVY